MTINIYISNNTKDKLKEIQKKYHVSISTIAEITSEYVRQYLNEYKQNMFDEYLEKDHRERTSIKPKNLKAKNEIKATDLINHKKINFDIKKASHLYSNILYLYANEIYNNLFLNETKKAIENHLKKIEKQLIKKKEIYWNYNANIRNTIRIMRKNKEYFKRILANEN